MFTDGEHNRQAVASTQSVCRAGSKRVDELNCDFILFAYDVVISLIAFADLDQNRFNRTFSLNGATRSHRIIKLDNMLEGAETFIIVIIIFNHKNVRARRKFDFPTALTRAF